MSVWIVSAAARRWDILVIGGGATGLGTAVDAAARGYRTLLLEAHDFAQGTSSRSTKLIHGGVRYLAQGNIPLVREALHERGLLLQNAPHLVHRREFVVPAYHYWQLPYYGMGLWLYDRLAGKLRLGRSRWISRAETLTRVSTLRSRACAAASSTPTASSMTPGWPSFWLALWPTWAARALNYLSGHGPDPPGRQARRRNSATTSRPARSSP